MGYEFFGEKIIFPSVPGINNDQSLMVNKSAEKICTALEVSEYHRLAERCFNFKAK